MSELTAMNFCLACSEKSVALRRAVNSNGSLAD